MAAAKKLVIVESPTKARTIRKYLGPEYRVEASMGHVRDLPASADEIPDEYKGQSWARLGVNVDDGFAPIYIVPSQKKKVVAELRRALKDADEIFLATDEDREGESIGWHLVEVLSPKVPVRRMVFHEITKNAIKEALESPRALDNNLVQAQETRRVLDRLVGYVVSPLLWKKVAPKLSAGRVQSAAVRLLVLRERERMAFRSGSYWDLRATLEKGSAKFDAQLFSVNGTRIATGKDFDENTGKLIPDRDVRLLEEKAAKALAEALVGQPFRVTHTEVRETTRSPYPPFTTSTLQQESNRKLGLSANRTMRVAQRLYENGHITYMRTDSVNLSTEAVGAARSLIERKYGKDFLSNEVRQYATKSKGAQEAHEAIRPAGTQWPTADELGLSAEEAKLYDLIWKRAVATQMQEARLAFTNARMESRAKNGETAEFRASGREVLFPGFFRAYVEGSDDPDEALDDQSQPLPPLKEGDTGTCDTTEALRHDTKPPARYSEASLVKALEANGIGRPSTYASIIETIQYRGYVTLKGKQLAPTFTAMAVTQLLETALTQVVDLEFTAGMEQRLDEIATGKDALPYLTHFYNDELLTQVDAGGALDARTICTVKSVNLDPFEIRVGRYGAFVQYGTDGEGKAQTVSLPTDLAPSDVTKDVVEDLVRLAKRSQEPLGQDPKTGEPIYVLSGRFGPYVQRGQVVDHKKDKPKRVSVPKSINPTSVDFPLALKLLELPRPVGNHPETGKVVRAGLGRFGPYVVHDGVYASLKAEDDVLTVGLERALELLANKKPRRRGSEPLKELGQHPEDQAPVQVMNGPYGAYIKWGKINASVPDGVLPEDVNLDMALPLLAAKAELKGLRGGRGKGKGKAGKEKDAAEAGPAKKAKTAKKTAAKKTKKKAAKPTAANGDTEKAPAKRAASKKKTAKKKTAAPSAGKDAPAES